MLETLEQTTADFHGNGRVNVRDGRAILIIHCRSGLMLTIKKISKERTSVMGSAL